MDERARSEVPRPAGTREDWADRGRSSHCAEHSRKRKIVATGYPRTMRHPTSPRTEHSTPARSIPRERQTRPLEIRSGPRRSCSVRSEPHSRADSGRLPARGGWKENFHGRQRRPLSTRTWLLRSHDSAARWASSHVYLVIPRVQLLSSSPTTLLILHRMSSWRGKSGTRPTANTHLGRPPSRSQRVDPCPAILHTPAFASPSPRLRSHPVVLSGPPVPEAIPL